MRTIRWGMIGCGDVAEVKSGPGFYKARNSKLVAVMRRNGALAEDFARRHNVPRWHTDADAIIEAPDIDAVYIATQTDSHHEYTLRCAAAGKPVYVEKPMALSATQCIEMIGACKASGVPLWVGYYRRALPRFLAVRDLVAGGEIGDVRLVNIRHLQRMPAPDALQSPAIAWRADAARGGGIFFEAVGHTFDILDYMLGPIVEVRAFAGNHGGAYPTEDAVVAAFRFESGVYGAGSWSYCADRDEEYNEIVGSRGSIRFSTFSPVPIRVTRKDTSEELPIGDPPHVHQPLIQSIVDELNGEGRCPSTGQSALRTAHVLDAVLSNSVSASLRLGSDASRSP
jgi:predicted dehydrogenase